MLVDEYNVAGQAYPSTLEEDLKIDKFDVSSEFIKHSETYGWYSTAYELAMDYEARIKSKLERVYALIDVRVRAQMNNASVRITEKKVENTVITDPEYVELQSLYQDAKRDTGLLKAARDAMQAKKDCLISLGANMRAEWSSEPSIKHRM